MSLCLKEQYQHSKICCPLSQAVIRQSVPCFVHPSRSFVTTHYLTEYYFREFAMAYTTWSGGVKFLHSVVRNFIYLFTVTPLCESEFQL